MLEEPSPVITYYKQEVFCAAVLDTAWVPFDDRTKSLALQRILEEEFGLAASDTSIGTGAAAAGFLFVIPATLVSSAAWLFFKGEKIEPNIQAWKALYEKYLQPFFKYEEASFDRGSALALIIAALTGRIGHAPESLRLISYKRCSRKIPDQITRGNDGEIDERDRIQMATTHVFYVEADDRRYECRVDGNKVTFIDE